MKKALLVLVVLSLVFAACATKSVAPVPQTQMEPVIEERAWIVFDKYPAQMNAELALKLGLHEVVLTKPLRVLNCMDKKKELQKDQTLSVGTTVLVGEERIPIYKRDCWNKIFAPVTLLGSVPTIVVAPPVVKKNFLAGLWSVVWDILKCVLIVLGILMLLLILSCLFRAVARAVRWLLERFDRNTPTSAPASKSKSATTTLTSNIWSARAYLDEKGNTVVEHVKGKGCKSLSTKISDEEVLIKAFRR